MCKLSRTSRLLEGGSSCRTLTSPKWKHGRDAMMLMMPVHHISCFLGAFCKPRLLGIVSPEAPIYYHHLMSGKSFEPASFECDRRLSRAARELVKQRILPLLPTADKQGHVLNQFILDSSTCIFHPDRDVLLQDELHSEQIPAGAPKSTPSRRKATHWFECGYCGKTFLTRYYLDLHLETSHSSISGETRDHVCPATEYCRVFGSDSCQHMALELEPFYGRGSGGSGPDAHQVRQMNSRKIPSCNEQVMQQEVQTACRQAMQDCFAPNVADDLIVGVCDTLTCHNRLHQLAGHVVQHVHAWKSQWDENHNHSVDWAGAALVLFLSVYYALVYGRQRPRRPTNRLLSKTASPSKWNGFRRKLTKKKQF